MFKRSGLLFVILLLAGCAGTQGRDFTRPNPSQLQLGQTLRANILALYGEPQRQSSLVVTETTSPNPNQPRTEFDSAQVPGAYSTITYNYSVIQPPIAGGGVSVRSLLFGFWNNTLIVDNFISNFPTDSSNFDETKLSDIVKTKTTKAAVVQLLGPPSGGSIYPAVQTNGDEMMIYEYAELGGQPRQLTRKRLEILVGKDEVVRDYRFASNSQPAPNAPTAATPAFVPLFIPAHK
jgi:hypothetical protein